MQTNLTPTDEQLPAEANEHFEPTDNPPDHQRPGYGPTHPSR